jgi:hypothetical protein
MDSSQLVSSRLGNELAKLLIETERRLSEMDSSIDSQREIIEKLAWTGADVSGLLVLLQDVQRLRQLAEGHRDWLINQIRSVSRESATGIARRPRRVHRSARRAPLSSACKRNQLKLDE